jgi:hypothetical protein
MLSFQTALSHLLQRRCFLFMWCLHLIAASQDVGPVRQFFYDASQAAGQSVSDCFDVRALFLLFSASVLVEIKTISQPYLPALPVQWYTACTLTCLLLPVRQLVFAVPSNHWKSKLRCNDPLLADEALSTNFPASAFNPQVCCLWGGTKNAGASCCLCSCLLAPVRS